MIKYEKVPNKPIYTVTFHNGVEMGELYMEVDGYYVWWSKPGMVGFVEAWILRSIADKLDEINKEWDETVKRELI